jgi:uncharacterized membrane protein
MKSISKSGSESPYPARCLVCGKDKKNMMPMALIRPSVIAEIKKAYPDILEDGEICAEDLNHFRSQYIQSLLADERGELSQLDREVIESLRQHDFLSTDLNVEYEKKITFGEALSDKIAAFGGSWRFIIFFGVVMLVWILINTTFLLRKPFDPYPFILLNLMLSCLAAMQAPVIMMSQNRQEAKDRMRGEHDYRVNLKAELEIRHLHEKIDHLLSRQWERLVAIQQVQVELMEEIIQIKERRG